MIWQTEFLFTNLSATQSPVLVVFREQSYYNRLKALFAKFTNHTRSLCNIYQDCGLHAYYAFSSNMFVVPKCFKASAHV